MHALQCALKRLRSKIISFEIDIALTFFVDLLVSGFWVAVLFIIRQHYSSRSLKGLKDVCRQDQIGKMT